MKAALFDMDGTLFDTNRVNYLAYKKAFDHYGIDISFEYYRDFCNGKHYTLFVPPLVNGDVNKVESIHKIKKQAYETYLSAVKVNSHIFQIIESIKNDYKIALVTSASKKNTDDILNFFNKKALFDLILTGDDIKKPKPDPEGFLLAMKMLDASPNECMIFEDSDFGIESAKATGASVFKVETF